MASVELAVLNGSAGLNKLVVVKKLLSHLAKDPSYVAMFVNEARVTARLSHPNVVSTFEVGNDGDVPFIVMEYLEGQALSSIFRRIGRPQVPLPLQLQVLRGLLSGLEYTHNLVDFDGHPLGVVHRDVSPQNAFVCYDGRVKLLDFGIAKVNGLGADPKGGALKGKIPYMAPEQLAGNDVDRRADVYSAGILLWEALAGRRMTLGEGDAAVMAKRRRGEIPDLLALNPAAPRALVSVCHRALAFDRSARFASAADMLSALDHAAASLSAGATAAERDLGTFVTESFVADRAQIRAVIESQLKNLTFSSLGATALPEIARVDAPSGGSALLDESTSNAAPTSTSVSGTPLGGVNGEVAARPAETTLTFRSRSRRGLWAGLALAGVGGGACWLWLTSSPRPLSTVSPAPPPSAVSPRRVTLVLRANPPDAVFSVDGQKLRSNPTTLEVARDSAAHHLHVQAGAASLDRTITYDRDQSVVLDLRPREAASHVAAAAARTPVAASAPSPSAGEPAAPRAPDPSAVRASEEAVLAHPASRGNRSRRALDEQNPY